VKSAAKRGLATSAVPVSRFTPSFHGLTIYLPVRFFRWFDSGVELSTVVLS